MGQQPSDHSIYERLIPSIGFLKMRQQVSRTLDGMKSAWTHVQSDYVLFVPCDVTFIPKKCFHGYIKRCNKIRTGGVVIVEINDRALYPVLFVKTETVTDIDSAP